MTEQIELPLETYDPNTQVEALLRETRLPDGYYYIKVEQAKQKSYDEPGKVGRRAISCRCVLVDPEDLTTTHNKYKVWYTIPIPLPNKEVPEFKVLPWQISFFDEFVDNICADQVTPAPTKVRGVWMCGDEVIDPEDIDLKKALRARDRAKLAVELWNNPAAILEDAAFYVSIKKNGDFTSVYDPRLEQPGPLVPAEEFDTEVEREFDAVGYLNSLAE